MSNHSRMLIGWREWVSLPALGLPVIKAKVDTGARTSALHAFDIETFERAGTQYVRFSVHPLQSKHGRQDVVVKCEAPVVDYRLVSDSGGHREKRYVIETEIRVGTLAFAIEVTLANRESMTHRMLLGRTAMRNLIIEPTHSYLLGKPSSIVGQYKAHRKSHTKSKVSSKRVTRKRPGKLE